MNDELAAYAVPVATTEALTEPPGRGFDGLAQKLTGSGRGLWPKAPSVVELLFAEPFELSRRYTRTRGGEGIEQAKGRACRFGSGAGSPSLAGFSC